MRSQIDVGVISAEMTHKAKALHDQGLSVALYSPENTDHSSSHDDVVNMTSLEEFVLALKQPRQIRIELDSWKLLNTVIDKLCPLLDDDDLLIDDTPKLHHATAV